MKAITLHQPYASLIAAGYKQVETRSWPTNHRGLIAIHAGKKSPSERIDDVEVSLRSVMAADALDYLYRERYPLGAVVAVAEIEECTRMDTAWCEALRSDVPVEYALGDHRPDRYAWMLVNVRPITPVVCRGERGIWQLDRDVSAQIMGDLAVGGVR